MIDAEQNIQGHRKKLFEYATRAMDAAFKIRQKPFFQLFCQYEQ